MSENKRKNRVESLGPAYNETLRRHRIIRGLASQDADGYALANYFIEQNMELTFDKTLPETVSVLLLNKAARMPQNLETGIALLCNPACRDQDIIAGLKDRLSLHLVQQRPVLAPRAPKALSTTA